VNRGGGVKKKCDAMPCRVEHEVPMFAELDMIEPAEAFDGPTQMALDEVLLSLVHRPTLRVYRWKAPCVTFGYFQPHALVEELHPGLPAVRRWTGGGLVVHGEDLTFSLMIPGGTDAALMPPASFYRELHHRLGCYLARVVSSEVRLAGNSDIQNGPACFAAPACDDLLAEGRKILGGAQRRSAGALLYQGSIQGLSEWPSPWELAGSLSPRVNAVRITDAERARALFLAGERYASPGWFLRR